MCSAIASRLHLVEYPLPLDQHVVEPEDAYEIKHGGGLGYAGSVAAKFENSTNGIRKKGRLKN